MKRYLFIMEPFLESLQYAWKTRRAWWFTATARTRERYARTALGSFWLGLSTLLSVAVLATVYGTVFKVKDFGSYVVYLGIGIAIWNSLATAAVSATTLLVINSNNIKNTSTNPVFYACEEWAFQVQTFLQSFLLVVLALTPFQPSLLAHLATCGFLPFINLLAFLFWFPLLICLLGARYQDLFQLVPILLQLLFLLSPILYFKESLARFAWTADYNPLYRILSGLRQALINGETNYSQAFFLLVINVAGLAISLFLLEKSKRQLPFLM